MRGYTTSDFSEFINIFFPTVLADRKYFASHTETVQDIASKKQLRETIAKFTREQLQIFMAFIIQEKRAHFLFLSAYSSSEMLAALNEESRKKDNSIPSIYGNEFLEYVRAHPVYYFDYLSKKTIAKIFCDHIDKHICLAAKVAKVFYRSGYDAACDFVRSELDH